MNRIEIKVLNPDSTIESEKMMVCAARLTQRGHIIKNMDDFMKLYESQYSDELVNSLLSLPHSAIQKLDVINVVVVGASRRFLSQITRHQNEVKFISASLQYSDYSDDADFCVPYEIIKKGKESCDKYISDCKEAIEKYKNAANELNDNDSAGYLAPQGLRNVLIVSATPYQWKHMIKQRTCRRNTEETRYVMLKIWKRLYELNPRFFKNAGPFCTFGKCQEGKMYCGSPMGKGVFPSEILKSDFGLIYKGEANED